MTEVLHSSSSSPSPSISTPTHHNGAFFLVGGEEVDEGIIQGELENKERRDHQLSLLALLVTLFRKSFWMACKTSSGDGGGARGGSAGGGLEIGWPTNVRHVAHVTFDRFNGFLGLPVEFEPEVPSRPPSASLCVRKQGYGYVQLMHEMGSIQGQHDIPIDLCPCISYHAVPGEHAVPVCDITCTTVFGVSTESMQLSFDSRGNSVPMIILLMQRRLYAQGGLQAEGIFRINAENSQEEFVRDQLNRGIVPEDIDVHCLAGLIKAWFRELPRGVLDPLSPEQVMQSQSEGDCAALVRLLPPSEAGLLDWAINLMADVVQLEHVNKMNARNIAMVFAPNMTQMSDPLTALMYAVQVMNFLKTLIEKTLKEREDLVEQISVSHREPSDGNGHQSPQLHMEDAPQSDEEVERVFIASEPEQDSASESNHVYDNSEEEYLSYSTSARESGESLSCGTPIQSYIITNRREPRLINGSRICPERDYPTLDREAGQSGTADCPKKLEELPAVVQAIGMHSMSKESSNLSRINSVAERFEAWC